MFKKIVQYLKIKPNFKLDFSRRPQKLLVLIFGLLILVYGAYLYYFIASYFLPKQAGTLQLPVKSLSVFVPVATTEARPSLEGVKIPAPAAAVPVVSLETVAISKEAKTKVVTLTDPFVLRIAVQPLVTDKPVNDFASSEVRNVEPDLEGIWIGEDMKIAFISGQALIEGSTIMGWRVRGITKNQVVLGRSDGRTKILRLEGQ